MEFKEFYETKFPPELKPDFEEWVCSNPYSNYSEDIKWMCAGAFIAGVTAEKKRDIRIRKTSNKILQQFLERN